MYKHKFNVLLLLPVLFLLLTSSSYNSEGDKARYWIIFKDKGIYKPTDVIKPGTQAYDVGKSLLTVKAVNRRLKVLSEEKLIDFWDLPIEQSYISNLEKMGIEVIAKSRWFNGVSAHLTKDQLAKVLKSDFVAQIRILDKIIKNNVTSYAPIDFSSYENPIFTENTKNINDLYNYGKSKKQIYQINVNKLHNLGITGKGVLIAMFDSGFEWRDHEATRNLNIIDEFDFINKDNKTYNEPSQKYYDKDDQSMHGTATLSTMAGFLNGKLIGPAFGSEILLAKTEYGATETPMEEDFYLEAAEWVESKGADIITSSLGYRGFDPGFEENSYTWKLFNGKYAITSLAGERAAYLGIVVLSSAGNNGQTDPPSIGSPAEGDSIIGVGAVDSYGELANFSSNGPTSDGRIKPDIVAMGVGVFCALPKTQTQIDSGYSRLNGTSFSCPISAGAAALILSVHPELTPMQVREAMIMTADRSNNPNNKFGWGLIDAFKASIYFGMIWSNEALFEKNGNDLKVTFGIAAKDNIDIKNVKFLYSTNANDFKEAELKLIEGSSQESGYSFSGILPGLSNSSNISYYFYYKDSKGNDNYFPLKANEGKYLIKN